MTEREGGSAALIASEPRDLTAGPGPCMMKLHPSQ